MDEWAVVVLVTTAVITVTTTKIWMSIIEEEELKSLKLVLGTQVSVR